MKLKKFFVSLFLVSVLIWNESMDILAMTTGFSTEDMELDEQQRFLSAIGLSVSEMSPKKDMIKCFDVNKDGMIALGAQNSNEATVSIYRQDGVFQYAYHFNCSGSYGIEWEGSNLIIYFVRADVAALFDRSGENIGMYKIPDTNEILSIRKKFPFSRK